MWHIIYDGLYFTDPGWSETPMDGGFLRYSDACDAVEKLDIPGWQLTLVYV